jgi:hypothetical protein
MPREIYVLTSGPVTFEAVVRAAAEVDETLGLRRLDLAGESALQLVGDDGRAVLTCWTSRRLAEGSDVQRVTRGLDLPDGTVWWTEAQAPWGRAGDAGVAVAIGVAALLGGRVKVEDGT